MQYLELKNVKRISRAYKHAAFTDLIACPFDKHTHALLSCYRCAENHVSLDGIIEICRVVPQTGKRTYCRLVLPGWDLRDPKFLQQGKNLILYAYAKNKDRQSGRTTTKMVSYFSVTGQSWSTRHDFGDHGWWLWRISSNENYTIGLAYNRKHNKLNLYSGDPRKQMEVRKQGVLSKTLHGVGYPNESHIVIKENNDAIAVVRRDADTFTAKLGHSRPPFTQWKWHDLGIYIGGPCMINIANDYLLISGREYDGNAFVTSIWLLNTRTRNLRHLLILPSSGDNSYPGMAYKDDTLYVSYYSSHIDQQARVYLAEISGLCTLKTYIDTLDEIEQ